MGGEITINMVWSGTGARSYLLKTALAVGVVVKLVNGGLGLGFPGALSTACQYSVASGQPHLGSTRQALEQFG
jgi:hypothetical protein